MMSSSCVACVLENRQFLKVVSQTPILSGARQVAGVRELGQGDVLSEGDLFICTATWTAGVYTSDEPTGSPMSPAPDFLRGFKKNHNCYTSLLATNFNI